MTFPTAEDIKVDNDKIDGIYCNWIQINTQNEKHGESLKQQILSEHEIVERLKERMYELPSTTKHFHESGFCKNSCQQRKNEESNRLIKTEVNKILKSILENKK